MKKTVNILGRDYKIRYKTKIVDKEDPIGELEELLGMCDDDNGILYIKKGMLKEEKRETIIHEIVHGVIREMERGDLIKIIDTKNEEKLVDRIAKTFIYNKLIKGC